MIVHLHPKSWTRLFLISLLFLCVTCLFQKQALATSEFTDPRVFDSHYYLNQYQDLWDAGIDTQAEAQAHWLNYGINEGRQASPGFHSRQYLEAYSDLSNTFGLNNYQEAIRHYVNIGWNEGRLGSPFDRSIFDWQQYINNYPGLCSNTTTPESCAKSHWILSGIAEGRQAMYGFRWIDYSNTYPEVISDNNFQFPNYVKAIRHWQYAGIAEGRRGTPYAMPLKRVGIFYSGWHAYAASAMAYLKEQQRPVQNMENIIQQPNGHISSILSQAGLYDHADAFHYHIKPNLDYYCIYRPRFTEIPPSSGGRLLKECQNITKVTQTHAQQLSGAGIDFVAFDSTNLPDFNRMGESDVIQLRPLEVLFEEWKNYADQGNKTPQIAVWANIKANTNDPLWKRYLNLYNDSRYSNLVMKDPYTGKKVFFVTSDPDKGKTINIISTNGGRNDVIVVKMWVYDGSDSTKWQFLSPCIVNGKFTTSITGIVSCNQRHTPNSPLGTALSVDTSYQLTHSSIPFRSSGKNAGLTFEMQFAKAFELRPDNLFIVGWNEFIAQPQDIHNPNQTQDRRDEFYGDYYALSMGLVHDYTNSNPYDPTNRNAPNGWWAWIDTYGSEFSRDIEPTVEYGSFYYDLMKSCIRAYRNFPGATCNSNAGQRYVNAYSLVSTPNLDHLVSVLSEEKNYLVQRGTYREICSSYSDSTIHTIFCNNKTEAEPIVGPFILFSIPIQGTRPLYRCFVGGHHFLNLDSDCGAGRSIEGLLGYVSIQRTSETPRTLRKCRSVNGANVYHFHSLDFDCEQSGLPNVTDEGIMGYVR